VTHTEARPQVAVHTHTEWQPLREIILGTATGAQVPTVKDESLHAVDYDAMSDEDFARIRVGPLPKQIIDEANEDLEAFADELRKLGIRVHRPAAADFSVVRQVGRWRVDGYAAYCPRDTLLTIGTNAIETPMALRHRQDEARLYRHIVRTVRAPVPRLLDSIYDRSTPGVPTLRNDEPVFDAANCLKCGRDILFLIANTGNQAGADWLQSFLGREYRVHALRGIYQFVHIDSTIVPLRPGLVLLNPERVNEGNMPAFFRRWDKLYAPEPVSIPCDPVWGPASKWIALNLLSLSPELVVVEHSQVELMRALSKRGIESLPVRLRHMRTMKGGPHCATADLVRDGELEDYS
jgi:glycine amidinotransferase/scyllo-inosamine-4-phosphate amidinotransferase 1